MEPATLALEASITVSAPPPVTSTWRPSGVTATSLGLISLPVRAAATRFVFVLMTSKVSMSPSLIT